MKYFLSIVVILLAVSTTFAQDESIQIGSSLVPKQINGGYYDYSDPEAINIKVSVWGYVKFPGKYLIPSYSTYNDLISYAGGPLDDANLEELKSYRQTGDTTYTVTKFDYQQLFWEKEVQKISFPPQLKAGDILIVPGEEHLFVKDYITLSVSILSALISLSILILNIAQ